MHAILTITPAFSRQRNAWCIYQSLEPSTTMNFLWQCKDEQAAKRLADEMQNGAAVCKGCKKLGNACGKCIKCECVV